MRIRKRAFSSLMFLFLIVCVVVANLAYTPHVKGTLVTNTVTLYASSYDGSIVQAANDTGNYWASGWPSTTGAVHSSDTLLSIGQSTNGVYRSFLFFDCSSIPATATLTGATLGLYVLEDGSATDFSITVQAGTATYPHMPLTPYDYYYIYYTGNYGALTTAGISASSFCNITLSTSIITQAGTTELAVRSSREITPDTPAGDEYICVAAYEYGLTSYAPRLTVTYQVEGTGYIIHGPYYESGLTANANVSLTVYQPYNTTLSYALDGTDGNPDTIITATTEPALYITWNITGSYNYTRVYYCDPSASSEEIWVYIPSTSDIVQQYNINVIGLAALSNAYATTMENVDGSNRIIERQELDIINSMPFWLCMYRQYTFVVSSDQGTWSWTLPADTVGTKTFTITADMVESEFDTYNITAVATRVNGTYINFTYFDPDDITTNIATQIMHLDTGLWVVDYTQTDSGTSSQTVLMPNATAGQSYVVNVTATRNTGTVTYQIAVAKPNADLFWSGAFDLFGTWPIPSYQIPALVICIFIFGIGSWRDSEALSFLGLLICGILQVIGWAYFPTPGIAMAFMIVVFMYLHRGKQEAVPYES